MSEHVVSYYSVVHASDGPCSLRRSFTWDPISAMEFDRACKRCLPDGLPPIEAPTPAPVVARPAPQTEGERDR